MTKHINRNFIKSANRPAKSTLKIVDPKVSAGDLDDVRSKFDLKDWFKLKQMKKEYYERRRTDPHLGKEITREDIENAIKVRTVLARLKGENVR